MEQGATKVRSVENAKTKRTYLIDGDLDFAAVALKLNRRSLNEGPPFSYTATLRLHQFVPAADDGFMISTDRVAIDHVVTPVSFSSREFLTLFRDRMVAAYADELMREV